MTLVVAQLDQGTLSAVSDTGIGFNDEIYGLDRHLPKLVILSPTLAVGFSGGRDKALEAFAHFPHNATMADQVIDYFRDFHRSNKKCVDFLILFGGEEKFIVKISGGQSTRVTVGWIGEQPAFEQFQAGRNPLGPVELSIAEIDLIYPPENRVYAPRTAKFMYAMRAAIRSRTVHGFCVAVDDYGDGFLQYRAYGVLLGPTGHIPWRLKQPTALDLKEVAEYAHTCLVSYPLDACQALAFHHLREQKTHLYFGRRGRPLSQVRQIEGNLHHFTGLTKSEYGINWNGRLMLRTPFGEIYGMDEVPPTPMTIGGVRSFSET